MKYGKKRLFLLVLIPTFFVITQKILAQAQTPNYDVTVSPVFYDLTANPGETITQKARIRNNTTTPLPIKLQIKAMGPNASGNLVLKDTNPDGSLAWISFKNSNNLVIKPLEWVDIPFTITIPNTAAYGYYFAISFTQDDSSPLAKTGAKITGAAAIPILLNVKKEGSIIQGKLLSFSTDKTWYEYLPVNFSLTFQNTGNIHIRPKGTIFIHDWLGNQIATIPVNNSEGAVLPNSIKTFQADWDDSFITLEPKIVAGQKVLDNKGRPKTDLKINWTKILDTRIGRYTATALIVVSTPQRDIPYQIETSFWVFPWKLVVGILLFIIFALIGFLNTFRNIIKKILKIFNKKSNND